MRMVNIHTAKTHLSKLVEEASKGEEIVIAKSGKPMARLAPLKRKAKPNPKPKDRPFGLYKGRIWISPDFDDPLPEEMTAAFRGERP